MDNPEINNQAPAEPVQSGQPKASEWALECERLPEGRVAIDKPVVIGRGADCDLVIAEPYLSRRHVAIEVADGCLKVEDLGSANGTYVNGERVSLGEVRAGDEIRLDQLVFTVIGPPSAAADSTQLRDPEATALHAVADPEGTALLAGVAEEHGHTRVISVPQACLVGEHTGSELRFELKAGQNRIGRALENEVSLTDPSVSSRHAELVEQQGQWILTDLNSTNGSFVNGSRVDSTPLEAGDRLRFGQVELTFVREFPPGSESAGAAPATTGRRRRATPWWLKLLLLLLFLGACGAGALLLLQQGSWPEL